MASSALEEKINKIRLQNEEIRRRYEEVEADKKNAAKSNALVQMVPSDDWPERREPPEFTSPPKTLQKQKSVNEDRKNERPSQHYSGIQERLAKKEHKFAEGEGPPPDPKYNFLADSERETRAGENSGHDEDKNKPRNRTPRGGAGPKRRGGGNNAGGGGSRDAFFKDNRGPQAFHSREESLPEYEAWRAERDRIDEARINRQKTAEGNWRREWDCNKVSLDKEQPRRDFTRKDSNMFDRRNNHYENDYSNRGHGGSRTYHPSQKNYNQDYRHPHHEQPHEFKRQQSDCKTPLSPVDNRSVAAFDQSIKVTVNQGSQVNKPAVMSVKVNSPSIVGTGRVGPRQKSRITYSSQSSEDATASDSNSYMRQKSFDEKTAAANFSNGPKLAPKSPFSQRKREGNPKSPYFSKKEFKSDESPRPKSQPKASHSQRNDSRDQRQSNNFVAKPQRIQKRKLDFNKTGNVSVVEDSVPVENNINKPIDNELVIHNNDSVECETNDIHKEISDVPNVLDNAAIGDNEVIDDVDGIGSFDNGENVEYDSNVVNEENIINFKIIEDVVEDQFEDAEENHKSIEIDSSIKTDESPDSKQNDESFDVYSYLVNDSAEIDDFSANFNKESLVNHEKDAKVEDEVTLATNSYSVVTDAVEDITTEVQNALPLDNEIKEVTQTPDDSKNAEVDIDLTVEKKENAIEDIATEVKTETDVSTQPLDNQAEEVIQKLDDLKHEKVDIDLTVEKKEDAIEDITTEVKTETDVSTQPLDNQTEEVTQKLDDLKNEKVDIDLTLEKKENIVEDITTEVKTETDVSTQPLDNQTEEVIQKLDDLKNEKVDIDLSLEKKETAVEEKPEEKITSNKVEEGVADNEQPEQKISADKKADDLKVEDNSATDLVESENNTLSEESLNKHGNDSGFLDNAESDSLNKTNATTVSSNDSAIFNDSNTVADLDILLDNQGAENNNEETPEPAKSDIVDATKEDCEKIVEICDNVSAALSDTQTNEGKEKVNEILENSVKDNDAKVVEKDQQSSEASKVVSSQEATVEFVEKKVEPVSENSVENVSEESKKE